jgi:hypothetical protein
VSSASDVATWTTVSERPAIVRATLATHTAERAMDAATLLADVTAGLADHFSEVLPVDAVVGPTGAQLLHAATGPDGEGVAIETRLAPDGTAHCWVAPTARYAAEADTARRIMVGRPATSTKDNTDGVRVARAHVVVTRPTTAEFVVTCHAGAAEIEPVAGPVPAADLPASAVPAALWAGLGLGPRPLPGVPVAVVTSRAAADRMLAAAPTDADAVRAALAAPDLPDQVATALAGACANLVAHWHLAWAAGDPDEDEPADGGTLEILDGGVAGLWRISDDLPDDFVEELGDDGPPVVLAPVAAAAVWRELTVTARTSRP